MGPKAKCSCTLHDKIIEEEGLLSPKVQVFNLSKGKKVPKSVVSNIVKEGHLSERANFLCSVCVDYFRRDMEPSVKKAKVKLSNVDQVCLLLDNDEISHDDVDKLSHCLGKYINRNEQPKLNLSRNLDVLEHQCHSELPNCFGHVLVAFMLGVSSNNNDDKSKDLKVKMACEQVSGLMSRTYIGTLHYCLSLITHYLTGSSNVLNILHKMFPTAHYSTLIQSIDNTMKVMQFPESGDGVVFFDNNQILSRRWNVVYDCKSMVSVVTTLLFLQPPCDYELQKNPALCPFLWLNLPNNISFCFDQPVSKHLYKSHRNTFIADTLKEVYLEQVSDNGNITDYIDFTKPADEFMKQNGSSASVNITFDTKGKLVKEAATTSTDPYSTIKSGVKGKPTVTLLDPVFQNPCSYESIASVFEHVGDISNREWIAVGCDGLPYLLGSRIIDNYHVCSSCDRSFSKLSVFQTHCRTMHPEANISVNECKKFKNLLLIPGLGHFEINYVKALFKLLWPVVLKDLAKLMGYKSMKALFFCEKATNHHKSWTLLQICLDGCSKELVLGYVRDCLSKNTIPSVPGYFEFISTGHSQMFQLLFRIVFDFLFGVNLFRKGVRRVNSDVIQCAMHQLSVLFYGLNMTSYMEIDIRRQIVYHESPAEVKTLINDMACMSHSGHASKAEGCDFILEGYNRKTKMWMPPGAGNSARWLRVYRNLPYIERLKQIYTDSKDDEGFRKRDNTNAVAHWRKHIRDSNLLSSDRQFVSLSGDELDFDLINFATKCAANKERYCASFPDPFKCERIFFTPDDRKKYHDVSNKTKAELGEMITQCIQTIGEEGGDSDSLLKTWSKEVKNGLKAQYLEFYSECIQILEQVTEECKLNSKVVNNTFNQHII